MEKLDIIVIKKDGTQEKFDVNKILVAVQKSASRVLITLSEDDKKRISEHVINNIKEHEFTELPIATVHKLVEAALESVNPLVAKSYKDYRNYKKEFVHMMDEVYTKSQSIRYIGDRSNANTDSALVATKRSLIFNELNKELYKKFFLNANELQASKEGYIYIHDMSARLDTINCCLFDMAKVLKDGFEMGNVWYREPNSLDTAFDVMSDVILSAAAQQYGGFTVPEIDKTLSYYAEKSYKRYRNEYFEITDGLIEGVSQNHLVDKADAYAMKKVEREFEQGWQGLEYKLNTVGSSRGDYPFVTVSFGLATDRFGKMASITLLKVHSKGHGRKGFEKPVLFPKLVFLYDKNLHGKGCINEDIYEAGIECSSKTMYPDWLSLTGNGYVAEMYKKYGKVVSPMGKCKLAHVKPCEPLA